MEIRSDKGVELRARRTASVAGDRAGQVEGRGMVTSGCPPVSSDTSEAVSKTTGPAAQEAHLLGCMACLEHAMATDRIPTGSMPWSLSPGHSGPVGRCLVKCLMLELRCSQA